jgi:hypothetical protein
MSGKVSADTKKGYGIRVGIATDHGGFALKEELIVSFA